MLKLIRPISYLLIFALVACGSDEDPFGGSSDGPLGTSSLRDNVIQFYKTSGSDSDLVPFHAIRIYDNATNGYSFWRGCAPLSGLELHSVHATPTPDAFVDGPETSGPDCEIDITFDYSNSLPVAVGEIRRNGSKNVADLNMVKVSESEFKSLLSDPSSGFERMYKSSVSMRARLDQMCGVLFGSDCDESVL